MVLGRKMVHTPLSRSGNASLGRNRQPVRFVKLSDLRERRQCEQVAAVCYRVNSSDIEFLLVRTSGGTRWTFPKGNVMPGLSHAQAAALEAFEEAGVHGRIEEASFARYASGTGGAKRSASGFSGLEVKAHLCQVVRLAKPKESKRDRTWFSALEAKQRLKKGRDERYGAGFARVIDRAVARIQRLINKGRAVSDQGRSGLSQQDRRLTEDSQRDPLQRVQFEAAPQAYGFLPDMQFIRKVPSRLQGSRPPAFGLIRPKLLQADVLQFSASPAADQTTNPTNSNVENSSSPKRKAARVR
jgi:8-oxo-dGTP pyrophosphatase MutT (NUDIX family)